MEVFGLGGTLVVNRPDTAYGRGQLPIELFRVDAAPGLPGWVTPHSLDAETRADRTQVLARASLVEHLADCLDAGTQPLPSAVRARHVLEIMLAAEPPPPPARPSPSRPPSCPEARMPGSALWSLALHPHSGVLRGKGQSIRGGG